MNDLTLLYYTANTIENKYLPGHVAEHIRKNLLDTTGGIFPIVSVSQKPIDFGKNICVGPIGRSLYNFWKQVFIGAKEVKTKFVACCDDDALYNMEHFAHRPSSDDVFSYNSNMWYAEDKIFWKKGWTKDYGMCCCICATNLLIKTLTPRFKMFPEEPMPRSMYTHRFWQEPGRFDNKFGVFDVKIETFTTATPIIVLNYTGSMCGKRGPGRHMPKVAESIKPYGRAKELWLKLWL